MAKLPVGRLVFDSTIYPRCDVDAYHVNEIAMAIQSGCEMPPLIVEEKSNRIIDGFHRAKAYIKKFGPLHQVNVAMKTYPTERDLFIDAIRLNSSHGKNFDSHDRAHCAVLAIGLKIGDEELAKAMHVATKWLSNLRVDRLAFMNKLNSKTGLSSGLPVEDRVFYVPLKRTIKHMAGKGLSEKQCEANKKIGGMSQSFYVNQIITLIDSELLNTEDEKLMERIDILREKLAQLN